MLVSELRRRQRGKELLKQWGCEILVALLAVILRSCSSRHRVSCEMDTARSITLSIHIICDHQCYRQVVSELGYRLGQNEIRKTGSAGNNQRIGDGGDGICATSNCDHHFPFSYAHDLSARGNRWHVCV